MMLRGFGLTCLLLAAACGEDRQTYVIDELPEGIEYGALVVSDGSLFSHASPLTPRTGGRFELPLAPGPSPEQTLKFVGWTAEALEVLLPLEAATQNAPLRLRQEGEPGLPDSSWAAVRASESETFSVATTRAPELSASWLPDCPRLEVGGSEAFVEVSCAPLYCAPRFMQLGCRLELDVSGCGIDEASQSLEALVRLDGKLDFRAHPQLSNCGVVTGSGEASFELSCSGPSERECAIVEYRPPLDAPIVVNTQDVSEPFFFSSASIDLPHGSIRGLEVLSGGEVVVLTSREARDVNDCTQSSEVPDELVFLDAESMQPIRTATIPPCADALGYDSWDDILVTSHGAWDRSLRSWDRAGRSLETVPLPTEITRPGVRDFQLVGSADERLMVFSVRDYANSGTQRELDFAEFVGVRLPTLEMVWKTTTPGFNTAFVVPYEGDRLIALDEDRDELRVLDAWTGETTRLYSYRQGVSTSRRISATLFDPVTRRVLQSHSARADGALMVIEADFDDLFHTSVQQHPADLGALMLWPEDPTKILVATHERSDDRTARVGFVDVRGPEARFLPSWVEVGRGPSFFGQTDSDGRAWFALPWAGRIVRVSPGP